MPTKRGYGDGSIRPRKDGKFEVRITIDGVRRSFYADTKAEANKLRRQIVADRDKNKLVTTDHHTTVGQYLERWYANKHNLRSTTRVRYGEAIRLYLVPALGRIKLVDLGKQHVVELNQRLAERGLKHNTVVFVHGVLRNALNDAVRDEILPRNVAALIKGMKQERAKTNVWSVDEAKTFLSAIEGDPYEAFYVLSLTTGMRRGEVLGLHWNDVDLNKKTASVRYTLHYRAGVFTFEEPKTDAGHRQLPLTDLAVDALKRLKKHQIAERMKMGPEWVESGVANHGGLVFTRPNGTPERGNHILQRKFEPLCERLGLPRIRLHDLRHTNASMLYALGYQDAEIATMLGHSSPSVTREVYVHVGAEKKRVMSDALNSVFSAKLG